MQNKKVMMLLSCMITMIIGIIIMVVVLLISLKNDSDKVYDEEEIIRYDNIEQVVNYTTFFRVNDCINQYINYIKLNNENAYRMINQNVHIEKEYSANTYFHSEGMYSIDKVSNITVFVKGYIRDNKQEEEKYYIINLDYNNNTFHIIDSTKTEYTNAVNNQIDEKHKKTISIEKNEYNAISNKSNSDLSILKTYFEDFRYKEIYQPEKAFLLLDENYKKAKFNNDMNTFKQYIQNNLTAIQEANIVKHGRNEIVNGNQYNCVDQYGHSYKFTVIGINQYTITLDNYTTLSTDQQKQYEKLTDEQKALSNMDKVMKLINEKDYSTIYGYLNPEFKNTNFSTLEKFTTYMQANFFENNIVGKIGTRKEGNVYLLKVPYKESLSSAAEENEKTFIMRLGEGMNFELSFEI